MEIEFVIKHIRDREYMSGAERDKIRIKSTGEVFTREWLARQSIDSIGKFDPTAFTDPNKTFIDPAGGDGNLVGEVLIKKIENGIDFQTALNSIFMIDIMPDNVKLAQNRLLCGQEHLRHIVERNIICADALRYHYRFDGTDPYKTEKDLHFDKFFAE
jgi:hypothetical protein